MHHALHVGLDLDAPACLDAPKIRTSLHCSHQPFSVYWHTSWFSLELCADVIVSAAARAAGPKKSAAAQRGVDGQKQFFLRFTKKFRSILKI